MYICYTLTLPSLTSLWILSVFHIWLFTILFNIMDICLGQHTFFLDFIQSISSIQASGAPRWWKIKTGWWSRLGGDPKNTIHPPVILGIHRQPFLAHRPLITIVDPPPGTKPTSLYDLASHALTLTSLGSRAASEGWMVGFNQQTKTYFAGWTLTKCMLGVWVE